MKNYRLFTKDHRLKIGIIIGLSVAWCIGTFMPCSPVFGADEPIIVDHNAILEFDQIPDEYIEKAKDLTFHFETTTGGLEIVAGLAILEIDDSKYSVRFKIDGEDEVEPEGDPSLHLDVDTQIHHEDYWSTEVGRSNTRAFADSGEYNYSMWLWDDEDYTDYEDIFIQDYLQRLDEFEQAYPDIRFIYTTRYVLDGEGIADYNDMIRAYCRDNNKVLFDIEDIMAHSPFDPDSEELEICLMKAQALWWMIARLAGWDGVNSHEYMLGDVSGNERITAYDASLAAQYAVGLIVLTPEQVQAADVSGNGEVTAYDASLIAQYAVGLIDKFPVVK